MKWKLVVCLLLAVLTLAIYWPVTDHQFVSYDDDFYVVKNPLVTAGLTKESISRAFTTTYEANWHPLTWLSHQADCQLYGLDPKGHHLTNLLLHVCNTLLLFILLQRLTGATGCSALVAALFALHPLHVESVAWVAERKDLLCALFGMLTLLAYQRYAAAPSARRYLPCLALFTLGLMAKPMLVTLPFLMLLLDYWPLARMGEGKLAGLVREKLPLLFLTAASIFVTVAAQHRDGAVASTFDLPLAKRLANAVITYVVYLEKTVWPDRLAVFYPFRLEQPWWQVAGATLLLAVLTAGCIVGRRRYPWLSIGWFWFLGMLVPVIGLVQVGMQGRADRYTYLPLIGIFIIIAWGGAGMTRRWRQRNLFAATVATIVLSLLMATTRRQLGYWQDSVTLFGHALAVTKDNFLMHQNMADALTRLGRNEEAKAHLQETLRLRPLMPEAHFLLGNVLYQQGKLAEAEQSFRMALRIKPDYGFAHNNLGAVLAAQGRDEEAAAEYVEALRLNGGDWEARQNLGEVRQRLGR